MSRHRFEMVVDVDDEALAAHAEHAEQRGGPYSTDPSEWNADDVFAAEGRGIIERASAELTDYDAVPEEVPHEG